jgi:hypothetical protein
MTRWPLWSGQLAGNGARWNSDVCRALFVGGARPKRSIPRFPSRLEPLANCVTRRRGQAGDLLLSNGQMVSVNRLMQQSGPGHCPRGVQRANVRGHLHGHFGKPRTNN